MKLEFPDTIFDQLAERVAEHLSGRVTQEIRDVATGSPWKNMEEAAEYTRLPKGTFQKLAAAGHFKSHGGRRKVFHVAELDRDLGYVPSSDGPTPLRKVDAA